MRIGVLGTGVVGRTIGSRLIGLGHEVQLGSRQRGHPDAREWAEAEGQQASAGVFSETAAFGTILFNCTKGEASLAALEMATAANLKDKVLIDVANPLDFSQGMPPRLTVCNTDSLGEQIQRAFPEAKVVKALNTMGCQVMVDPRRLPAKHHTFVSGNDVEAKAIVRGVIESFGWYPDEILDLGDITTARGTEMYLSLWVRIYGATGSGAFNLSLVSAQDS